MRGNTIVLISVVILLILSGCSAEKKQENNAANKEVIYKIPDTLSIPGGLNGEMIRYGRELIQNFPEYLGPEGKVGKYAGNYLSCQNCHLEAGTRPFGLNFLSTHARYPQYRAREGRILSLAERVNNCIERPLNGKPMPLDSKEMNAILMYMKWVSQDVPVEGNVPGDQLMEIELPTRAADPEKGKAVYAVHCSRCHGSDGQGVFDASRKKYIYPALWGQSSYQPGSSMHRLIKSAQFIYANMPQDLARWDKPVLTIEEAFDVAAYINDDSLHLRPDTDLIREYPILRDKPVDFAQGPWPDPFPQHQHKYGPFGEIIEWRKKNLK